MAARNDARRFLERLPPRARAVAWLTYVDGMLQHEVAETLGVSRRTVVNSLNQVRTRLGRSSRGGLTVTRCDFCGPCFVRGERLRLRNRTGQRVEDA
jgi:DNA-binding NarL/FixJ family response regulator